jgi:hypothetical protein
MSDFYLRDMEQQQAIFASLFRESAGALPDADRLSLLARRAIANNALDRACRAFDEGTADQEPVDGYVELALELYPDATKLQRWHMLQRRRAVGSKRAPNSPAAQVKRMQRDIADRLRYRRWRWSGV